MKAAVVPAMSVRRWRAIGCSNQLVLHLSIPCVLVSKLWEPLALVAGLRRQVLHIRAHSARHRVRDLHFRTAPAY